jgi:hypothetical protein
MTREAHNDLFQSTFMELHQEAPAELLRSLRERLEHIRATNPQSAQTADACLRGLRPDNSTLLHVLTAAYLINGGVMLKHNSIDAEQEEETLESEDRGGDFDFKDLEEELNRFTEPPPPSVVRALEEPSPTRKNLLSTD